MSSNTRVNAIDEQGRALAAAFERAEAPAGWTVTTRPRWTRRLVFSGAAAAVATIALLLVLNFDRGGSYVGAEEALGDIARRIELAPEPREDQFQFSKSRDSIFGSVQAGIDMMGRPYEAFSFGYDFDSETWHGSGRKGLMRNRRSATRYPSAADKVQAEQYFGSVKEHMELEKTAEGRAKAREIDAERERYIRDHPGFYDVAAEVGGETGWSDSPLQADMPLQVAGETYTAKEIAALPRDPQAILEWLRSGFVKDNEQMIEYHREHGGKPDAYFADFDQRTWDELVHPMRGAPIPTDLRAAMVRALALLPGIRSAGEATNEFGHRGERFVWENAGVRNEVVFNKSTASPLETKMTVIDPAATSAYEHSKPGDVVSHYQLIEQATVDELPPPE